MNFEIGKTYRAVLFLWSLGCSSADRAAELTLEAATVAPSASSTVPGKGPEARVESGLELPAPRCDTAFDAREVTGTPDEAKQPCDGPVELAVDACLPLEAQVAALEAWREWADLAGPHLSYRVTVEDRLTVVPERCRIKLLRKQPPAGYGGWTNGWFDSRDRPTAVVISVEPDALAGPEALRNTMVHELGHAVGEVHDPDPRSVMNPAADVLTGLSITCADEQRLCHVWGCAAACREARQP